MDGIGHTLLNDSLTNLVTGLGTTKDRGAQGRFGSRLPLSRIEIDAIYGKNWLGGKVVDIPADDMTREWRAWRGVETTQVDALEATERALHIRSKVNLALKMAAKDGGAALLLGAPGNPWEPLNPNTIPKGGLRYVHLMSRYELQVTEMEYDPASPWVGQAKEYRIAQPDGGTLRIHPSRVIRFIGVPRTDTFMRSTPWGESVFERLHDAIRDATSSSQAVASMLQEAKLDVVKIPGLSEGVVNEAYRSAVLQRFALAMATKSINNTLIFDAAEEWEQKTLTFQGLPEIMEKLLQIVAGAADMPVTRLLGRSPAGLNATGRADLEGYYTMVRSRQETNLRPAMDLLDIALIRTALGRMPRGIFSEWRPLWSVAESDQADIDQKRALAVQAYANSGIFTHEALQAAVIQQLEEDSFLPGIKDAVGRFPGTPGAVQVQAQKVAAAATVEVAKSRPAPAANPARARKAAPPR